MFVRECVSHSVMSNSQRPHGMQASRFLCSQNSLGKDTGVGSHSLLQGIFPVQGLNSSLLHCRQILYQVLADLHGEGNGIPLQYSCLENPMDGGAWKAAVHGVAEGRTRLSDFTFTFNFHALEKEMATHSSVLAWRIPGTGKPGGLLSMGSHRVGHD